MDNLRMEEIRQLWVSESEAPETQEWRDDLTPEELEYIDNLDNGYVTGVQHICTAILVRERVQQRYSPAEICELETIGDHCRLWLRDGSAWLARLTSAGELRLDPIDTVC